MPYRQIRIDALEVDGNLMYTARATLNVYLIDDRVAHWSIKARINSRADAAKTVSIKVQSGDRTYSRRGEAAEHLNHGGPTDLEIEGAGLLQGFDATIDLA
jgi:hypothetical protein